MFTMMFVPILVLLLKPSTLRKIRHVKNISYITIVITPLLLKYYINQKLSSNVVKHTNNKNIEVNYILKGRHYKFITSNPSGPNKILLITDENDNDLTHMLNPYIGPDYNFHNKKFTPDFWSKKRLSFQMSDGSTLDYNQHDTIDLY